MKRLMLMMVLVTTLMVSGWSFAQAPTTAPTTVPTRTEVDAAVADFVKPIDVASGDGAMQKKLKEHHNTAALYLQTRIDAYHNGTGDALSVLDAARIVIDSKRGLATGRDEQVKVMRRSVDLLKMAETRMEDQWKRGVGTQSAFLKARLARESNEIELMKLEGSK